jgi:hypothetical protein
MEPVLTGYFPKITALRPEWLKAAHITEICSASECMSSGPSDWIDAWKHNDHWVYDSLEIATSVIMEDKSRFEIFAFKQYPIKINHGKIETEEVSEPNVTPLPADFKFLGYDAVSRSAGNAFECSPLSCNGGAETIPCNPYCLFDTFEDALEGAKTFSSGVWEPGPYYVVEIYRGRSSQQSGAAIEQSPPSRCI